MQPIQAAAAQRVGFTLKNGLGLRQDGDTIPTVLSVNLPGGHAGVSATVSQVTDSGGSPITGEYYIEVDASTFPFGAQVRFIVQVTVGGVPLTQPVDAVVLKGSAPAVSLPPVSGVPRVSLLPTDNIGFVGNSYRQNFGSMPTMLSFYLGERGVTAPTLGPTPHLPTTISPTSDGWYIAQSLGGMTLFPTIDQSGGTGSTDATDAVGSQPDGTYDYVAMISGMRQDFPPAGVGLDREFPNGVVGGSPGVDDVYLEITRQAIAEFNAASPTNPPQYIKILTQEQFNNLNQSTLTQYENNVRIQVLGARTLESEGLLAMTVPEHYVWSRLMRGKIGTAMAGLEGPVPAYTTLTHPTSGHPGGRNWFYLFRTNGASAPFNQNNHQNAIATIVAAWIWGYAAFGLDPRGDLTFAGVPNPAMQSEVRLMIEPTSGAQIYGGHRTGVGLDPWNTAINPGGPPDSNMVLDWSPATQLQIQERIVAALDDYYAGTTEFD